MSIRAKVEPASSGKARIDDELAGEDDAAGADHGDAWHSETPALPLARRTMAA
jgi:hypothetical protein